MKIVYTGSHRTARDSRANAADRLRERRANEDRRSSAYMLPEEERRADSRRTNERRSADPRSFSRETERRLIKLVKNPKQNALLRTGSISCPCCGGQLKAKAPTKWAARVIWEVRCLGCSRLLVHQAS